MGSARAKSALLDALYQFPEPAMWTALRVEGVPRVACTLDA